ncbi:MAG: hypothetical protein GF398_00970 [Chitinivibrionales bacterium]|nr:hypothetical protein [Chitinivibrionales bacterium]
MCKPLTLLIVLLSMRLFSYNHPELGWKTVATRHFKINYYDKTEPAVYATAGILESIYPPMARLYGYRFEDKINVSLADYDDFTNGFAAWTQDNITVWLPDARIDERSNSTWLRNVLTHELAHIISLRKNGFQLLSFDLYYGYTSPAADIRIAHPLLLSRFYPTWFVEGAAQLEADRAGNDCWDARRDMILRCAVLDDRMLSLDEMGYFSHPSLQNEMVYNHGYSLTKHINDRFGKNVVGRLFNAGRDKRIGGGSFKMLFREHTQTELGTVYRQWLDGLRTTYRGNLPKSLTQTTPVWSQGAYNHLPKVSPDGRYRGWLTSGKGDSRRTDLVICRRDDTRPVVRLEHAKASWDFSPDGKKVYFIQSYYPNRNGSYLNDLFVCDIASGKTQQLSHDARVYDVEAHRNGRELICTRYRRGAFELVAFDVRHRRFELLVEGELGKPFQGISQAPHDDNLFVVGRVVNGTADLFVYHRTNAKMHPLCTTEAQEESPCWAADGRIYFSADYDGVFDIYSQVPMDSILRRHSRVKGGAFQPEVQNDAALLISEYTSRGFKIRALVNEAGPFAFGSYENCTYHDLPRPKGKVRIKSKKYDPAYLRRDWRLILQVLMDDRHGFYGKKLDLPDADRLADTLMSDISVGIGSNRTDALGKKLAYFSAFVGMAGFRTPTDFASANTVSFVPTKAVRHWADGCKNEVVSQFLTKQTAHIERLSLKSAVVSSVRQADADTVEASGNSLRQFYVMPLLGYQNHMYQPSFGLLGTAILAGGFFPAQIVLTGNLGRTLGRDFYASIMPQLMMVNTSTADTTLVSLFVGQAALSCAWRTYGYYNEDILYHRADLTTAEVGLIPAFMPAGDTLRSNGSNNYAGALELYGNFLQGLPVLKYASLHFELEGRAEWYSTGVVDVEDRIGGKADFYFRSRNELSWRFPVWRNIQRGTNLYADALYGAAMYRMSIDARRAFFTTLAGGYFAEKNYRPHNAHLSHEAGLRLTLGYGLNYLQAIGRFSSAVYYDIWRNKLSFDISIGL